LVVVAVGVVVVGVVVVVVVVRVWVPLCSMEVVRGVWLLALST
jgi:hypothetical protein